MEFFVVLFVLSLVRVHLAGRVEYVVATCKKRQGESVRGARRRSRDAAHARTRSDAMDMIGQFGVAAARECAQLVFHVLLEAVLDQLKLAQMVSLVFV